MSIEIIFTRECEKCNEYFDEEEEKFEYKNTKNMICKSCCSIKNKCETCSKRGFFNFEEFEYGVRCKYHKEERMVNVFSKIYCERRFVKNIEKLGGRVIGDYIGNNKQVKCECKEGHKCNPRPGDIQQGRGMCRICVNRDYETSRLNFIKNIEKLGGKVIGEYNGKDKPVHCECKKGHECNPCPSSIQKGQGMCKICANNDYETAKQNFIKNIEKLGGKVIEEYNGKDKPVHCECGEGHKCNPRPNDIRKGGGMCRVCVNLDPETAKQNFIKRIEELGGKVIGEYKGSDKNVECECKEGHKCNPIPHNIQQGKGMCNRCSQSGGESFISHVLEKLNINYETEVNNDLIKNNFRFDFYFEYNNKSYYLEFDGDQHFKYNSLFHRESKDYFFLNQQKDLFKNYIAKKSNIKMIRIAQPQIKGKDIEEFSLYLKSLIEKDDDLIVDHEIYSNWIFQEPTLETIEKFSSNKEIRILNKI